ncbi:histidine kinase [Isoptericola sp. AK164]|uniref:sensor histidine kinase n=1 Tax=Isoptericola sp. AK164 TaxID=3024246 RepID=UPI002418890F|nr:histidine kinase [Isoptericola sp. AK164]
MPAPPAPDGVADVDDAVRTRVPGRSARWVDVAAAAGTALGLSGLLVLDPATPPVGYAAATGFGALVLLRRRAPLPMLVLTLVGATVCAVADLGVLGTPLAAAPALCAAAAQGRPGWASATGGALVLVVSALRPARPGTGADVVTLLLGDLAVVVAAVCVGVLVRSRRQDRPDRGAPGPRPPASDPAPPDRPGPVEPGPVEPGPGAERLRVALDLQDVVGHHLSLVALHTDVAAGAVGRDDDAARTALRHVREATSATVHELRATALLLRPAEQGTEQSADASAAVPGARDHLPAVTGPAGLAALVQPVRAAGIRVTTRVDVPRGSLDATVDAAAYRIVQGALARVGADAAASTVRVELGVSAGRLRVVVADDGPGPAPDGADDGPGPAPDGADGARLAAMRDRATLLGGRLDVVDGADGGLVVTADLPARLAESVP